MKKGLMFLIIISGFSCAMQINQKKESKGSIFNKGKQQILGGDLNEHGCKASAGYTWSVLSNQCVRVFEVAIRLNHYDLKGTIPSTAAFVIFERDNGNKAELFLDTQNQSIILQRKSEGQPWVKDDWQLISWKGYVLKKAGEIKYTGK